jgi:hypothetical protein
MSVVPKETVHTAQADAVLMARRAAELRLRAEPRVGRKNPEQLAWLIRFSYLDAAAIAADTESLDAECRAFLWRTGSPSMPMNTQLPGAWFNAESLKALASEIQGVIKEFLEGVATPPDTPLSELSEERQLAIMTKNSLYGVSDVMTGLRVDRYGEVHFVLRKSMKKGRMTVAPLYRCKDPRDAFLLSAAELLRSDWMRIRVCANPDCRRPFVKRKRGEYCSKSCSQKIRTARHQKNIEDEERRRKRHEYYRRRVEKVHSKAHADKVRQRSKPATH